MKKTFALLHALLVGSILMVVSACTVNLNHPAANPRGISDDHRPAQISLPRDDVQSTAEVGMEDH